MYPNLIDVPLQLMKHFQNPNSKSKQCVLVKQMGVLFPPWYRNIACVTKDCTN